MFGVVGLYKSLQITIEIFRIACFYLTAFLGAVVRVCTAAYKASMRVPPYFYSRSGRFPGDLRGSCTGSTHVRTARVLRLKGLSLQGSIVVFFFVFSIHRAYKASPTRNYSGAYGQEAWRRQGLVGFKD